MKILVAGSRGVTDYEVVRRAFIESGFWKQYKHSIEIVSGTARGVDRLGEEFAARNSLAVHRFPADWDTYGKRAGYIRNVHMAEFVKEHNGLVLAIWDGESPGTKHMIDIARDKGLSGFIYRTDKTIRYRATIGMKVTTDYSGKVTTHTITDIVKASHSQSGVMFKTTPIVPKSQGDWIDADWFKEKT